SRDRQGFSLDLYSQISEGTIQSDGRAIGKFGIDITLPQISRLENVHVGIHRLEAVFCHLFLLQTERYSTAKNLTIKRRQIDRKEREVCKTNEIAEKGFSLRSK